MTKLPLPLPPPSFTYKTVLLTAIADSLTNPRKHFDQAKLEELSASIAANGILQAPAVRSQRAAGQVVDGKYVLIWGERRTKAARLAGLKEIQVKVLDVDDVKAAELQLIENDEREDLTPLERAEGYEALHTKHGLSYEEIAKQVERSRAWVYERVSLLKLAGKAKKALSDGDLDATSAALIAQLPAEFHEQALTKALGSEYGAEPMSSRDLKDWIRTELMLDLKDAPFDITDAQLVPKAGACTTCPKRTGALGSQTDLFADKGKKSPDLCKDKSCHSEKAAEHKRQVVAKAKDAGKPVLNAAESKTALNKGYNASYVRLDEGHHNALGNKTWGDVLKGTKLEPQLAVTDDGKMIKVALKEDVKAALKEKGSKIANSPALHVEEPWQAQQAKPDPKRELREKLVPCAILLMVEKIEKAGGLSRSLLVMMAQNLRATSTNRTMERRGWENLPPGEQDKRIATLPEKTLHGLLFELLFEDYFNDSHSGYSGELTAACKELDVDLKKLEKELADAAKLKASAEKEPELDRAAAALKAKVKPEQLKDVAAAVAKLKMKPAKKSSKKKAKR